MTPALFTAQTAPLTMGLATLIAFIAAARVRPADLPCVLWSRKTLGISLLFFAALLLLAVSQTNLTRWLLASLALAQMARLSAHDIQGLYVYDRDLYLLWGVAALFAIREVAQSPAHAYPWSMTLLFAWFVLIAAFELAGAVLWGIGRRVSGEPLMGEADVTVFLTLTFFVGGGALALVLLAGILSVFWRIAVLVRGGLHGVAHTGAFALMPPISIAFFIYLLVGANDPSATWFRRVALSVARGFA